MKGLLTGIVLLGLLACGGDPTAPDPLLTNLLPGEGVIRFTLYSNCPTPLTIAFGMDQFLYGPETLSPSKPFQDYQEREGVHVTSGRTFPSADITFSQENTVVVAGRRVVRVLTCP